MNNHVLTNANPLKIDQPWEQFSSEWDLDSLESASLLEDDSASNLVIRSHVSPRNGERIKELSSSPENIQVTSSNNISGEDTLTFSLINISDLIIQEIIDRNSGISLETTQNENFNIDDSFIVTGGDPQSPKNNQIDRRNRNVQFIVSSSGTLDPNLVKEDYGNAENKDVWIVLHGWNSDVETFEDLAATVSEARPDDLVLTLDWTEIAQTRQQGALGALFGLNFVAASWIRPLAEQVKIQLNNWGLTDATKINLVGHSLGSLLASEIASQFTEVKTITALDPPSETTTNPNFLGGYDLDFRLDGYNDPDDRPMLFSQVAQYSRAFNGDGSIPGNEIFASTAQESYLINFEGFDIGKEIDMHNWVVEVFQNLIDPQKAQIFDPLSTENLFSLGNFGDSNSEFILNAFKDKHEGKIFIDVPPNNDRATDDDFEPPNYFISIQEDKFFVYGTNQVDRILSNQLDASNVRQNQLGVRIEDGVGLYGGDGDDTLFGGQGDDSLWGGNDDDTLVGNRGNDILVGGEGDDLLIGNKGNDIFSYGFLEEQGDIIGDFDVNQDLIDIRSIFDSPAYSGINLLDDYVLFSEKPSSVGSGLQTDILVDPDGDNGNQDFITLVTLNRVRQTQLSDNNFLI